MNQSVIFTGKSEVELQERPLAPLGDGEVRIQTEVTLISAGTEMICLDRLFAPQSHWDTWVRYPFQSGYNLIGRVTEVGQDVTQVRAGDRVGARAAHQAVAQVDARGVYRVPEDVPADAAVWFGISKIVQNGVRRAEHALGETVVVIGLGMLGQLVTQYLRLHGAKDVIAIDTSGFRLDLARESGATQGLQASVQDAREAVLDLTGGKGAHTVYDITGVAGVFEQALPLVRRFGTLLLLGDAGSPTEQRLTGDVLLRGLRIVGAHDSNPPAESSDYAEWNEARMTELFFRFLERGDMRMGHLNTHRFPASRVVEAYDTLRTQRERSMGVLLEWSTAVA